MTEFKPERIEIPDGYRVSDLTNAYADAAEQGLWIKEWAPNEGRFLTAVGSYYLLQQIEHDNPGKPELDPQQFTLGDCIEISHPGSGASREESIRDGIENFKNGPFWEQHSAWHKEATDGTVG